MQGAAAQRDMGNMGSYEPVLTAVITRTAHDVAKNRAYSPPERRLSVGPREDTENDVG